MGGREDRSETWGSGGLPLLPAVASSSSWKKASGTREGSEAGGLMVVQGAMALNRLQFPQPRAVGTGQDRTHASPSNEASLWPSDRFGA